MATLTLLGEQAKQAARLLVKAEAEQKNRMLETLAQLLVERSESLLIANRQDLQEAQNNGLDEAMLDRLSLEGRIQALADDICQVAALKNPVGEILQSHTLDNALKLTKQRVPIGVIGVIYEARPNVTTDVASLCLKTGNCAILRGGSETIRTNRALVSLIKEALAATGLPTNAIQLIDSPDRRHVLDLLKMRAYVDMIIPRGGAGLHQFCLEHSLIPVITGGIGICHLFVDRSADSEKALAVIDNAKTQRPTVCNALDTLLVHRDVAQTFIPQVIRRLKTVSFKLDPCAHAIAGHLPHTSPAGESDWDTEWLSLILGIKVVPDINAAIAHIQQHSSGHSDGILTSDKQHARRFIQEIDSAAVYVNASTRFTDGAQFGLGAEVAVSTQKLHARGPMGLDALTTYKWIVEGNYQTRE